MRRALALACALVGTGIAAAAQPAPPGTAEAWRQRWTDPGESERFVEVITAEEIWAANARNLPELLAERSATWMTFTGYGGGSPTIRGQRGFDVAIELDGIPIPTTAYRFGELEFLSTIDLHLIERIEIVPAGGGIDGAPTTRPLIRLFTRRAVDPAASDQDPDLHTTARAFFRYATVDKSSVAHLEAHRRGERFGFLFGVTSRDVGDLRAGDGIGFQRVTGYEEVAGNARIHYFLTPHRTFEFDLQVLEQQNVPQYESVASGEYLDFRLNPRKRALFKISYLDAEKRPWADRLEASIYLNQHRQRSFEQLAAQPEIRTQGSDNDDVEGLLMRFDLERGRHRLAYGAEYSHEAVDAVRRRLDTLTGVELERGPDRTRHGQERDRISLWLRDRIALLDTLELVMAGRYGRIAVVGPYEGPAGSFVLDLEDDGVAGSLGVVWRLRDRFRLTAAYDLGFRLPAIDEITGFSPDPERVGVPNDGLEGSSIDSLELGLHYQGERLRLRAAWFRSELDERTVLLPTTVGGAGFQDLDGDGVRDPGEPAFVRAASAGRAELTGIDLALHLRATERLQLYGSLHTVEGDDPLTGSPLAAIPPDYGLVGLRWSTSWRWRPWLRAELRFYEEKSRLAPGELADPSLDPSTLESAEILQLTAGLAVADRLRLLLTLENPSDHAYRPFGSFLVGGGRGWVMTAEYVF